ncbi:hypothetical protein ACFV30_40130 [Streptomyces sp. NPDC059752]|uniref:hypothetical protein n=1 Tax=unclassified Streptomyces TaxID=2593676 RepID=UPI00364891B3
MDGNRAGTSTAWPEARALYRSAHDAETAHQRVTLYGTGIEPLTNLITNAVLKLLTHVEFSSDVLADGASVREALDTVGPPP